MEKLTLYHGSRSGLVGAIRPDGSRMACDFGQGFYMGAEAHQPRTLICGKDCPHPVMYALELDLSGLRLLRLSADLDWALFVAFNRGLMGDFGSSRFYARYAAMREDSDVILGKIARVRTEQIVRSWRHRDGLYFDEILERMAKEDAERPHELPEGGGK